MVVSSEEQWLMIILVILFRTRTEMSEGHVTDEEHGSCLLIMMVKNKHEDSLSESFGR